MLDWTARWQRGAKLLDARQGFHRFPPATELRDIKKQYVNRMAVGGDAPTNISDNPPPASIGRERSSADDEEIDIGVDVGGASRLRTEQDHQQRIHLSQNGISEGFEKPGIQVADSCQ